MYFNRKNAEQKNWRMIKKGKHFLFGCSLVFAVGASLATQVVHANTAEKTTVKSDSKAEEAKPGYGGETGTYEAPAVAEIKPEVATTPAVAAKLGGETAKEVKALDKTKLEKYIVEIEAKLANGTYERKTEESVAVLKADLEAAKATLENATTQDEITKAYNKLVTTANTKLKNKPVEKKETPAVDTTNGQPTVGKKAENTEKNPESNSIENTGSNDPRNGKALDKNNAFRAEIAYNIDSQGNDFGKKDSVITSGIRGSSDRENAITAVNSVMKYRTRYNADSTGKITSVDWQVFFNNHLQNFANDYGVQNEVFRNYIQIPNEVNMPTDIRRLQYKAEMKFVDRKYQLVGGDGSALSDTVTFDNPTPATAAGRALAKNEDLKINGNWDNYTRGLDTLYNNTSFYYKDAVKDELSDTKNLVNSNALQGKRVIYDNANTGGNYRDGYVWEFTTTVPDTVTNEQLKNMKVSMGMLSTGTAGVDHGFHRIAENPVNLSKADVTPPTAKDQTVKVGQKPDATKSIGNFDTLPKGTTVEYKDAVDTQTPGEKQATAVVTYPDTSTKEVPVKVIVEKEAVAPAKPVITTSLTGKANTKTPVEVKAEAGSTVSLFAHDGTKLGSAVANDQGVASITPTVNIPAGIVAATATKNGKTSEVSDPVEATPAADAATNNPAAPVAPVAPVAPAAPAVAPTVEIPYSDKATKEVYVYGGEENSFDIKFKDDSGKITSAIVNGGGNQPFKPVAGEENKINAQYGYTANKITAETLATDTNPAVITYRGTPAATDGLKPEVLEEATKGENPKGMPLGWRYATATDADGASIENKAVGSSNATDPGSFRVMLKPQTQKYDITIPAETEKVVVANPAAVTDAEFAKVKEKLKIEFSKTNNDANLAKDQGKNVEDKDAKIKTIEKVGNDLVVTYKDGSVDKKSLTEFVRTNEKPTVEIQYSDPAPNKKEVYVYASEVNSFDIKIKDDSGKLASAELRRGSNQEFKDVAGETNKQNTEYGFTANKFTTETTATADNPTVITYTGTPAPEGAFTKEKFEKAIQDGGTPLGWRFVKAIDKDGEDARGNGRDATDPTAVNVILKPQTQKYDVKTPAEADKVVVSDVNNVTDKEFEKIKEKVKLEYSQNNPDARLADKKGKEVENPADRIASITKDGNDVVVTYKDGSKDTKPLSEFVTKKPTDADKNTPTAKPQTVEKGTAPKAEDSIGNVKNLPKGTTVAFKAPVDTTTPGEKDATVVVTYPDGSTEEVPVKVTVTDPSSTPDTEAPSKPVIKTDLTDKAGTKTPVEVTAEPGSKVELFDKDGNKLGEGTADENGKATITPTKEIPAGDVTAKATDPAGNVSEASTPAKATTDTTSPAKPEIKTDLTDKAGTKTPVEVTAEPGSKVELFDKDGNKLGEGTADENGKATITPTVDIPAGDVTAKSTDPAGNVSEASTPAKATTDTTSPAKPEIKTDLTDKAGTKTPVEVTAEPGSKVELFDKDGNKLGEGVADENGKATITPTKELPAGDVTAKATDPAGNVSEPSTPEKATADTKAPAKPEIKTDLTDKAGTKTPVEVTAEPGSKVELFDKDGNKIGEGTADENGKATITPTVDIPAGGVTAKSTDKAGNQSEASEPKVATPEITIGKDVVKPADKTVVANPDALTPEEKKAIEDRVKAVNPGATVVVDDKGNATVTTPSGNTAVIPAADLTKSGEDAAKPNAGNDVVKPADKTVVANPDKLTDAEKKAIEDKVKAVNPGATVVVDDKGNATVTTPSGNTAVIPAADLTKSGEDAAKPNAGNDVVKPADKTVVANPDKLTDAEKKAIEDKVKAVNPGATVVVDDKGNATVTTPSGNTAVIPAADLTKSGEDAAKPNAGNDVVKPADKTVVANPEKLTDAEKKAIEDKVKAVNPGATVVVDDKGNATVTTPSGNTAVIPAEDLTKTSEDAAKPNAGNDVVKPADKTVVANPEKLTDAEKKAIEDKVKAVNPGATVVVDDKGNATVTTPSGNTAVIPAADLTKTSEDAAKPNAGNDVVKPADKTVVANPEKLTDAEKKAIEDKVKAVNPGATVVVDDKGNATVTTPSGNTAVIPAADLTKSGEDAAKPNAGNDVVKPADKTVVANPEKLTDAEKKAIEDKVKAVNPGATVVVDDKGNATVTTPSGNTAVIPAADLTKTSEDAAKPNAGNDVVKPADKTVVANPEKLTDAEKKAIEDKVKAVNPGATVVVDDKGNATVTTPSGNTAVIPATDLTKSAEDIFKQRPYVPSNGGGNNSGNGNGTSDNNGSTNTDAKVDKAKLEGAIRQLDELIIKESAKLDAETAKEANALSADAKKVFANADATQAEVDAMVKRIEDFMAKVASATDHAMPANDQDAQTPANAGQTASAQANARKAAKELPNTGTADSTVAMVAAAASALLGLGLAGRRRKEDEEA